MGQFAIGVFEPLIDVWGHIRGLVPSLPTKWKRPKARFDFIQYHYVYMVGMTIIGSVMLYPAGLMPYIDALFFAAGIATQSGLNTIDVNNLHLYQQVTMMLMTSICTPIFINTCLVFLRLYWFERRFVSVVQEVNAARKAKNPVPSLFRRMSRSKSQMGGEQQDNDVDLEKANITVHTSSARFMDKNMNAPDTEAKRAEFRKRLASSVGMDGAADTSESSRSNSKERDAGSSLEATVVPPIQNEVLPESPQTPQTPFMGLNPRLNREITFADEVPRSAGHSPELARITEREREPDVSKHIEFLERQQANAKKGGALRIPGPRGFDNGEQPEELDHISALQRLRTMNSFSANSQHSHAVSVDEQTGAPRRGINFDVGEHPAHRERTTVKSEQSNGFPDDNEEAVTTSRSDHATSETSQRTRRFTNISAHRSFARTLSTFTQKREDEDPMPYLSWTATTARNSMFLGLTTTQREELGGIEYRALKLLAKVLVVYYVGFHLLGMLVMLPWIVSTQPWKDRVSEFGQNPIWWGFFTPASMFNDLGFTLTPDSMLSFQDAVLPLLFGSFLIIIGNTGFPCMLRFILWAMSKIVKSGSDTYLELRFLLDHPRRCFTLLFPSKATWWLFWVLILLNVVDLIFFIILDLNQEAVTDLHPGLRVLNGWFQATSTRTAGFASVNLSALHAAIQVSYMIMMYISVFPIAISVRRTNVYEEKSLGLFGGEEEPAPNTGDADQSYVSQHLRRQLSFDLWYIFLGLFIIAIVEGDRIANTNQYAFTSFSVLFEIVSAYGTVGLSLGYPGINASFSAEFRPISKLVIIAMMIRGRHRGLPYALDRAILLPSEKLQQKEAEEAQLLERRMTRRGSAFAEGQALEKNKTWEDGELDHFGLPKQHTASATLSKTDVAMMAGADGDDDLHKTFTRKSSAMSTHSTGKSGQRRGRSLSRVIVSGLTAGPSYSKRD